MRFEPAGFTHNADIPAAKSIVDYVFRWLGLRFLTTEEKRSLGLVNSKHSAEIEQASLPIEHAAQSSPPAGSPFEDAPPCTLCGSGLMVRQGNCYVCLNCGSQGGCG